MSKRIRPRRNRDTGFLLEPGDKVIIKRNPHDPRVDGIVGTVIVFRPGTGFGGCDLVDVHYKNPHDGAGRTMPFGLSCLGPATAEELTRLAEQHETEAARLREMVMSMADAG